MMQPPAILILRFWASHFCLFNLKISSFSQSSGLKSQDFFQNQNCWAAALNDCLKFVVSDKMKRLPELIHP